MTRISSAAYVTAVLHFLQAFNRGDLDACESFLDPHIEWHAASTYKGHREVREMLKMLRSNFSNAQARPEDFREARGHVLIVVCFHEGNPDETRREIRQSWIAGMGDEDALIRRVLTYPTPAEAARALEALAAAAPKVPA